MVVRLKKSTPFGTAFAIVCCGVFLGIACLCCVSAFQPKGQYGQRSIITKTTFSPLSIYRPNNNCYNNRKTHVCILHQSQESGDDDSKRSLKKDDYRRRYASNSEQNRQWLKERFQFDDKILDQRRHYYVFLTRNNSILEYRANWLQRRLDCTDKEMSRIIRRHATILGCKPDTNLAPTMDCLEAALALDKTSLRKLVLKDAALLGSRKDDFESRLEYLKNRLGFDEAKLRKLIMKDPNILKFSIHENATEQKIKWIQQQLSLTDVQVGKILCKYPRFFSFSVIENMQSNLDWIMQRLSLTDIQVSKMIQKQPQILSISLENRMKPNLKWLQNRLSLTNSSLSSLICRQPQLLTMNITSNLEPTLDFYIEAIESEHPEDDAISLLVSQPALFTLSLDRRLRPRLSQAREANMVINAGCLNRIGKYTNEQWDAYMPLNMKIKDVIENSL